MQENTENQNRKYETPRGPRATMAKNKYRAGNYDRAELALPKGMKARLKEVAKECGFQSYNSFVLEAIKEKYRNETGKELTWEREE